MDERIMSIEYKLLRAGDEGVLARVAAAVFDNLLDERLTAEFLRDPRHHLVVAVEAGVVGFASAVHYVHPDKPAELSVNQVGVAPTHRQRGVGKGLLDALFSTGRQAGCRAAWVLTERYEWAGHAAVLPVVRGN